ncbi:NADH:flavin oxidoreductase/NADH oxidase [Xylaria nigripes]|nr:NADH:flavin oxidoreductase/NADH oxidase [Xylaria nigripes]
MAPFTLFRCDDNWVRSAMAKEYYEQRAAVPGTLLITEAFIISKSAVSRYNDPGLFYEAQIASWREITDSVHEKGSFIYCQIWHLGRAGWPRVHEALGTKLKSSSAIPINGTNVVPEEMTEKDIWEIINDFAITAKIAIKAGFDGVEIHDTCNKRTDDWGGSIEKRSRLSLEVTEAVFKAIGPDKTGIRLSPFSKFQYMGMEDPYPQFEYLVKELNPFNLAYLHLVEPVITGDKDQEISGHSLETFIKIWNNQSSVILAGGYGSESARHTVDEKWKGYDMVIAFGRNFISNPDLVFASH